MTKALRQFAALTSAFSIIAGFVILGNLVRLTGNR